MAPVWILIYLIWIPGSWSVANNLAVNRQAYQSDGDSVAASRAVDGDTDIGNPNTCTFIDTGDESKAAWWYVDLGQEYPIESVVLYNTDQEDNLGHVHILYSLHNGSDILESPSCAGFSETLRSGSLYSLCAVAARYIVIIKNNVCDRECVRSTLPLCEVVVNMATAVKDCPLLTDPDHGQVAYDDGTKYKSVATYSCDAGHLPVGDQTRKCMLGGIWSGSQPKCQVVDCGSLSNPDNGEVTYSSTTYNSEAKYSCDSGYALSGVETRQCGDNGNWSGQQPQCQGCPEHCQCDNNGCGECELWYVPDGECDVYLKPATLDTGFSPVLQVVTETTVVISVKQDTNDVPIGYEGYYYYQLLYRTDSGAFEIWPDSDRVYHVSTDSVEKWNGNPIATLTAKNLSPGTEYTFTYQIYRTHRGVSEEGPTTDMKTITVTTNSESTTVTTTPTVTTTTPSTTTPPVTTTPTESTTTATTTQSTTKKSTTPTTSSESTTTTERNPTTSMPSEQSTLHEERTVTTSSDKSTLTSRDTATRVVTSPKSVGITSGDDIVGRSLYLTILALAIIFGLALLAVVVSTGIFITRRHYLRSHKNEDDLSDNKRNPINTTTYENIDIAMTGLPNGSTVDTEEPGYSSLSPETRSLPFDESQRNVYQDLNHNRT